MKNILIFCGYAVIAGIVIILVIIAVIILAIPGRVI
jgi:hypothetical protein